jgi:hypothetical protein
MTMDWLPLVLMLVVFLVLLMGAGRWYMRRAHHRANEEFAARYPGSLPLQRAPANFFGLSSQGRAQVRGNGSLFLTKDKLIFKMLVPNRWIEVPIGRLQKIENPRSFLGKSKGRKLLAVYFLEEDGSENSAAWLVGDLEGWTRELRRITQN